MNSIRFIRTLPSWAVASALTATLASVSAAQQSAPSLPGRVSRDRVGAIMEPTSGITSSRHTQKAQKPLEKSLSEPPVRLNAGQNPLPHLAGNTQGVPHLVPSLAIEPAILPPANASPRVVETAPDTPPSLALSNAPPIEIQQNKHETNKESLATPVAYRTSDILPQNLNIASPSSPVIPTVTGQTLLEHCWASLEEGRQNLQRGACYSGRKIGWDVLDLIAQNHADQLQRSEPTLTLSRARVALREAGDFLGRYGSLDPAALKRMIEAHETKVLKQYDPQQLTSHLAADAYFEVARRSLQESLVGEPVAAEALRVIADSHLRGEAPTQEDRAIAITCLRAAVGIKPSDPDIANQLGYELLADGRINEAENVIRHSLSLSPSIAAWQNLAEITRQRGDLKQARYCAEQAQACSASASQGPIVYELSPQQFAQMSPPPQWQTPAQMPNTSSMPQNPAQPTNQPGRVASFFNGWWR